MRPCSSPRLSHPRRGQGNRPSLNERSQSGRGYSLPRDLTSTLVMRRGCFHERGLQRRYKCPVRKQFCRRVFHPCSSPVAGAREAELTLDKCLKNLAEGVGFEPTDACTSAVFKTAAIDHSATLPE